MDRRNISPSQVISATMGPTDHAIFLFARRYNGFHREAAEDYGRFLRTNRRYATCFAYSDQPDLFVDHLAAAGYATDPDYADKLKRIIRAHRLGDYDRAATRP